MHTNGNADGWSQKRHHTRSRSRRCRTAWANRRAAEDLEKTKRKRPKPEMVESVSELFGDK